MSPWVQWDICGTNGNRGVRADLSVGAWVTVGLGCTTHSHLEDVGQVEREPDLAD